MSTRLCTLRERWGNRDANKIFVPPMRTRRNSCENARPYVVIEALSHFARELQCVCFNDKCRSVSQMRLHQTDYYVNIPVKCVPGELLPWKITRLAFKIDNKFRVTNYLLPSGLYDQTYEEDVLTRSIRKIDKECFIQSMLHRLLYIFPSFKQFVHNTSVKIFPFWCKPFIEPFFHIFTQTKTLLSKCVIHRWKQVVTGRSQVW